MIEKLDFRSICEEYGMIPCTDNDNYYTFTGYDKYAWARYMPKSKTVQCWNSNWYMCGDYEKGCLRPASDQNKTRINDIVSLRKEIKSIVKNFKEIHKQIRIMKITEL